MGAITESLPIPDRPCCFGDAAEYERAHAESGQWVQWEGRLAAILAGKPQNVMPFHAEVHASVACNFGCRWCNAARLRSRTRQPTADELLRIVEQMARHRIGIQWVGGEPLCNNAVFPALREAARLSVPQCLFTNGSLLSEDVVAQLALCQLAFVRVSLNAVSPTIHATFHGYAKGRGFCESAKAGIRRLIAACRGTDTRVGISAVFDRQNVSDLSVLVEFVAEIADHQDSCFLVLRPLHEYVPGSVDHVMPSDGDPLHDVHPGGRLWNLLARSGVEVVLPTPCSSIASDIAHYPACSFFVEIGPEGEVYLCSDRYGDPTVEIGNIHIEPLDTIMRGRRRADVQAQVESEGCLYHLCPKSGRGATFNAHITEFLRILAHDRGLAYRWVEGLRAVLPTAPHSFFM